MTERGQAKECGCGSQGCGGGLDRRDFLKYMGATAAGMLLARMPVMAGPFSAADFAKVIPVEKKLHPDWVKALFARGGRAIYKEAELDKIGMPVGGLCAGQLYLGGDGTLWHWDIFNKTQSTGSGNYAKPPAPSAPLEQGFAIRVSQGGETQTRKLSRTGFPNGITFCGEYPIGFAEYQDAKFPVAVGLEAFSPFIPLNADDSSLPATVMRFTVKNTSAAPVETELAGWLQNAVCLYTGRKSEGKLINRMRSSEGMTLLECSARPAQKTQAENGLNPITFADFEGDTYGAWKAEGEAFGKAPARGGREGQFLSGHKDQGLVNTWTGSDALKGKLVSPEFTIERPVINFLIGGGKHPKQTCMNLVVAGKVVRSETGKDSDAMEWASWDVKDLAGKTAHFEILDQASGGWGHIDIDHIEFADRPREMVPFPWRHDHGTMALALLEGGEVGAGRTALPEGKPFDVLFAQGGKQDEAEGELGAPLVGAVGRKLALAPGAEATLTFVIAWHFPNWRLKGLQDVGGRYYSVRFKDAAEVATYLAKNFDKLYGQTKLWRDTWNDSTLPQWLLDRTFLNISTLATSTCYRLASGRFWAWEGVGCCHGTCTHVWHYAQAVGRIFPEIERDTRERVDYGISFNPETGVMGFRGEFDKGLAVDGQAGTLLRTWREHQMSPDDSFLRRCWPRIRKAYEPLLALDPDQDGMLAGAQMNTLDRPWFGEIAWLSSLYVAALRAGEAMAREMGDEVFEERCRRVAERGMKTIDARTFNGEYYQQNEDKTRRKDVGSFDGCEIDQVLGQGWAWQVGLPRVLPREHTLSALRAIWKYNFTPDVGPFRAARQEGRWYAMAGEGGTLMCAWPRGEAKRQIGNFDYYFNECMSGFEHQVAGHMIWEGMVQEGLALVRAIHDRYHPARRNPWNEVECGDHYARAMASYGVFLAACGYEYHGPKGHLGFAPRLGAEDFRAAFTAAEGWGTLAQRIEGGKLNAAVDVKWGSVRLKTLALGLPEKAGAPAGVRVTLAGEEVKSSHEVKDGRVEIKLAREVKLEPGQKLEVAIG